MKQIKLGDMVLTALKVEDRNIAITIEMATQGRIPSDMSDMIDLIQGGHEVDITIHIEEECSVPE